LTKILNLQFALESFEARINSREGNSIYCIPAQRGIYTKYVHIKSTAVYAPRRNGDSPQPPTRRLVCPLPPVSGGEGNTRRRERGWESPNSDEGHTLWYSLYVRTLWEYSFGYDHPVSLSSHWVKPTLPSAGIDKLFTSIYITAIQKEERLRE